MEYATVISSKKHFKGVSIAHGVALNIDTSEGFGLLSSVLPIKILGHNLENPIATPVIVEDFMLCEEETMQTS